MLMREVVQAVRTISSIDHVDLMVLSDVIMDSTFHEDTLIDLKIKKLFHAYITHFGSMRVQCSDFIEETDKLLQEICNDQG